MITQLNENLESEYYIPSNNTRKMFYVTYANQIIDIMTNNIKNLNKKMFEIVFKNMTYIISNAIRENDDVHPSVFAMYIKDYLINCCSKFKNFKFIECTYSPLYIKYVELTNQQELILKNDSHYNDITINGKKYTGITYIPAIKHNNTSYPDYYHNSYVVEFKLDNKTYVIQLLFALTGYSVNTPLYAIISEDEYQKMKKDTIDTASKSGFEWVNLNVVDYLNFKEECDD